MKLVLENGKCYSLKNFTNSKETIAKIVYNTQVVGYQEIMTDLTNLDKIVVMTYPIIGNYGLVEEDNESKGITVKAIIASEFNNNPSNFRYTDTLKEALNEGNASGYYGLDTRELAKDIRNNNINKAMIANDDREISECLELIKNYKVESDIISRASVRKLRYSKTKNPLYTIAIIDLGVNKSLISYMNTLGCNVVICPHNISIEELNKIHPDGIIISSGPEYPEFINLDINELKEIAPILGIGVGALTIANKLGYKIERLNNMHTGSNHPVKDLKDNTIDFYTQNHKYHIKDIKPRFVNVIDNTVEGYEIDNIIGTLFIPFTHKGPKGNDNIYEEFIKLIKEVK